MFHFLYDDPLKAYLNIWYTSLNIEKVSYMIESL